MSQNHLNTNKQFMIGNGILAFAVICAVVIFIYMSMKLQADKDPNKYYSEVYNIELISGFAGDSLSVYINDSLLLNTYVTTDSLKLKVNRFAQQSALLIVNNQTEQISTFNLSEKGGRICLTKQDNEVYILEKK